MANDIIARLRINGEQFSSESKSMFSAFSRDAANSGQQIKSAFESNFAQVQTLVRDALKMPSNAAGSLNLNVTGAQQAASQAQQQATALREVATAAESAARAVGDTSEATRLFVQAARSAATEAEDNAREVGQQAAALERLQAELNKSVSGVNRLKVANDQAAHASNSHRAGVQDLGYQISDFGTEVLGGISPIRAFAQQSGQAAFALSQMDGAAGKVGTFLAGPWGAALLIGVSALSEFLPAILDSNEALKKQETALDAVAKGADAFGDAEALLGKIIDLTTGKLKTHNQVLIETVKLQAQVAILQGREELKKSNEALKKIAQPTLLEGASDNASAIGGTAGFTATGGDAAYQAQQARLAGLKPLADAFDTFDKIASDPNSSADQIGKALKDVDDTVDRLSTSSKLAGRNLIDVKTGLLAVGAAAQKIIANKQALDVANGGAIPADLKPYEKPKAPKKLSDPTGTLDALMNQARSDIASYGDAPTFLSKANEELEKLQQGLAKLDTIKPRNPVDTANIAKARDLLNQAAQTIRDNLNKPFDDYLKKEDRALQLLQLQLQGRDVEAAALQKSFGLLDSQGRVTKEQLATVYDRAAQEERIARALEAQRREINLYVSAVGQVQSTVEQFLGDLGSKPGTAFKGLITGFVGDFRSLQTKLISNTLFGGLEQKISDLVKGKSPIQIQADQLSAQSKAVGDAFSDLVEKTKAAAAAMGGVYDGGANPASAFGLSTAPDQLKVADLSALIDPSFGGTKGSNADPTSADQTGQEIVVTARKVVDSLDKNSTSVLGAKGAFNEIGKGLTDRIEKIFHVTLPASLKQGLGSLLEGASIGVASGGAFASITGGKQSTLGSAIGGGLGKIAGGALKDTVTKGLTDTLGKGLGKALGSAVPVLGSIAGGILGNVLGGLFQKKIIGASTISTNADGSFSTSNSGNDKKANAAATSEANAVITSIQQVAQQLGAQITGASNITVGTYKGNYRVNTQGTKLGGSSSPVAGLSDFGDDQSAAIAYAVQAAISKGVISGISQASIKILQSGQDLSTAIQKALLIEQVPKDLKALVDPIGAAIDTLNEKFNQTVAALKEGGATADQMAQAQQLYNLELDQVKASTASASATLKDFLKTLNIGSASPLSLRDQESSAAAVLKPYLTSISAGQSIDQSGYQTAAQAYLDIERQLYGSTEQYFAAFDKIQAATSVAIAKIDNAAPIASPSDASSPFPSQTAAATQTTATNTQTSNEILSQLSDLQQQTVSLLAQLNAKAGASTPASAARLFAS